MASRANGDPVPKWVWWNPLTWFARGTPAEEIVEQDGQQKEPSFQYHVAPSLRASSTTRGANTSDGSASRISAQGRPAAPVQPAPPATAAPPLERKKPHRKAKSRSKSKQMADLPSPAVIRAVIPAKEEEEERVQQVSDSPKTAPVQPVSPQPVLPKTPEPPVNNGEAVLEPRTFAAESMVMNELLGASADALQQYEDASFTGVGQATQSSPSTDAVPAPSQAFQVSMVHRVEVPEALGEPTSTTASASDMTTRGVDKAEASDEGAQHPSTTLPATEAADGDDGTHVQGLNEVFFESLFSRDASLLRNDRKATSRAKPRVDTPPPPMGLFKTEVKGEGLKPLPREFKPKMHAGPNASKFRLPPDSQRAKESEALKAAASDEGPQHASTTLPATEAADDDDGTQTQGLNEGFADMAARFDREAQEFESLFSRDPWFLRNNLEATSRAKPRVDTPPPPMGLFKTEVEGNGLPPLPPSAMKTRREFKPRKGAGRTQVGKGDTGDVLDPAASEAHGVRPRSDSQPAKESEAQKAAVDEYLRMLKRTRDGRGMLPAEALTEPVVMVYLDRLYELIQRIRVLGLGPRRVQLKRLQREAFADAIEGPYLEAAFVDSERCLSELRLLRPLGSASLLRQFMNTITSERPLAVTAFTRPCVSYLEELIEKMRLLPALEAWECFSADESTEHAHELNRRCIWASFGGFLTTEGIIPPPAFAVPFWEVYRFIRKNQNMPTDTTAGLSQRALQQLVYQATISGQAGPMKAAAPQKVTDTGVTPSARPSEQPSTQPVPQPQSGSAKAQAAPANTTEAATKATAAQAPPAVSVPAQGGVKAPVNASAQVPEEQKPAPVPAKLCRQEMRLAKRKADKEAAKNHRANPAQAPPQAPFQAQAGQPQPAQAQQAPQGTMAVGAEPGVVPAVEPLNRPLHCPLSSVLMADPIVAADGVTYQRSAFKKYIAQCQASGVPFTSPLHKDKVLKNLVILPNHKVRALVREEQEHLRSLLRNEPTVAAKAKKKGKGRR